MKLRMSKAGFKAIGKAVADRKSSEAESIRKATSAKRCKELGVSGPDDPTLPLKVELVQLRKEFDALRSEFNEHRRSMQRRKLAQAQDIGPRPQSRSLERPHSATRAVRSR